MNMTNEKWWEKDFRKFLMDEYDNPPKGQTHRWLFCWDGEQRYEMPFDCACCLSADDGPTCQCVCHERLNQLKGQITAILAEHRRMILEEVVFAVGKEYPFWEASCCDKSVLKALRNVLNNLGIDTEPRA